MSKSEIINFRMLQKRGAALPSMDPQVWFLNANDNLWRLLFCQSGTACQGIAYVNSTLA